MIRLRLALARLLGTVTVRLALGYGALTLGSLALVSLLFYFGTVGVLARGIDAKLLAVLNRLTDKAATNGSEALRPEIQRLLDDGIDSDTEVYLVVGPDGEKIVGNLSSWPASMPLDRLSNQEVVRAGRPSSSRLLARRLADGSILVVGRDMQDLREIEHLVWRALETGGAFALQLVIGGAFLFRRQIDRRIATIRRTAMRIEAGDLSHRIPVAGLEDEFSRLGHDINHMLDRIQHLMAGVTHVSDAIAHDLRTPLSRIRSRLDEALRLGTNHEQLAVAAASAITAIDDLILVFDKLLHIAEAESGARRQSFAPVLLGALVSDIVEMYDAMAESRGIALTAEVDGAPTVLGDRDLLAGAIANLIDNALKYAGGGATVRVRARCDDNAVSLTVEDNGPGIPESERAAVTERFYRLDRSRSQPGNGLGLSIVTAVASLHRGKLLLDDAQPGLFVLLVLPRSDEKSFQTVS